MKYLLFFILFSFGCCGTVACQILLTVGFDAVPASARNFPTITEALQEVNSTEGRYEIWVKQGRYLEEELFIFRNVELYGGFLGREQRRDQRSNKPERTILDGGLAHRVACVSGVIDGFLVLNGKTPECGGGLRLINGVVRNCMIQNNETAKQGGGIYCEGVLNRVENSVVEYNVSSRDSTVIVGYWRGKKNTLRK